MIGLLRIVGLANVAIWVGASVFFTLAVGRHFFRTTCCNCWGGHTPVRRRNWYWSVISSCTRYAREWRCYIWWERGFTWGAAIHRWTLGMLLVLLAFSLVGGYVLQPQLAIPASDDVSSGTADRGTGVGGAQFSDPARGFADDQPGDGGGGPGLSGAIDEGAGGGAALSISVAEATGARREKEGLTNHASCQSSVTR